MKKADSTDYPAEARALRKKAREIHSQYLRRPGEKPRRLFDFSFDRDTSFNSFLNDIMSELYTGGDPAAPGGDRTVFHFHTSPAGRVSGRVFRVDPDKEDE